LCHFSARKKSTAAKFGCCEIPPAPPRLPHPPRPCQ
jgi:Flp pilus assembly protein TadB